MKQKTFASAETDALKCELRQAQEDLLAAYHCFDQTTVPELIEASIYEIKACRVRFDYLYHLIRSAEAESAEGRTQEEQLWV